MTKQHFDLSSPEAREEAVRLILAAPDGSTAVIAPPKRTVDQNAKMWPMLSDISRQRMRGFNYTPETWKGVMCSAHGIEGRFVEGLHGEPVPEGFSTSSMSVRQMADFLTFILATGDAEGIRWSDPKIREQEARWREEAARWAA